MDNVLDELELLEEIDDILLSLDENNDDDSQESEEDIDGQ